MGEKQKPLRRDIVKNSIIAAVLLFAIPAFLPTALSGVLCILLGVIALRYLYTTDRKYEQAVAEEKQRQENEKKQQELEANKWMPIIIGSYNPEPGQIVIGVQTSIDSESERQKIQFQSIPHEERRGHFYVVGATGMGKTKFLESLIRQDLDCHHGVAVIDPHGDLIEAIRGFMYHDTVYVKQNKPERVEPYQRFLKERVVVIDPSDPEQTTSFNPIEPIEGIEPEEIAAEMVLVFHKLWGDSWGPRLEDLLRHAFIALCEARRPFTDLPRFLERADFRAEVLTHVRNPLTRQRFTNFDDSSDAARGSWTEPALNKISAFLTDPRLWRLFSQQKGTINFRDILDKGKILLVNLNKGRMKDGAALLGGLVLSKLQMTALSRSDIPEKERKPFYVYIDEFQNFATDSFLEILSESRKYALSLTLAHQNVSQLTDRLKDAILGNCGLHAYFQVSNKDAVLLARQVPRTEPRVISNMERIVLRDFTIKQRENYEKSISKFINAEDISPISTLNAAEQAELIQSLEPQMFLFWNRSTRAVEVMQSLNVPDPWDSGDFSDPNLARKEARQLIGSHYRQRIENTDAGFGEGRDGGRGAEPEVFRITKSP